jgi:hypothetical protein
MVFTDILGGAWVWVGSCVGVWTTGVAVRFGVAVAGAWVWVESWVGVRITGVAVGF